MSVPPNQMVQQSQTVAVPKRFPLVSRPGFRSTAFGLKDPTVLSPVSDAAMFNCYAELDPEDNAYWVEKRPGTITLAIQAGGAGGVGIGYSAPSTGIVAMPVAIFGPNMYVWTGTVLSPVTYSGGHSLPLVTGRAATFVQVPYTNTLSSTVWAANGSLWAAVLLPGHIPAPSYTYSNVADFASSVPWIVGLCDGVAYLDSTLYVMDQNGAIWGSNLNDITTWVATTVIQAGGRQDVPVCLAQQLEYVIALKSTSFRCFYNAGASAQTAGVGSNLAWVEGADGNFGCLSAGGVQLIDQTLVWVSNNDKGTPQVVRMDGLQIQVISTPVIERLLQNIFITPFAQAPSLQNSIIYSNGIKRGGHRFYSVTIPVAATLNGIGFTLVYDLDQQLWYVWFSPGLSYWSVVGVSSNAGVGAGRQGVCCQDITSGAFYLMDIDQVYPTDSGAIATVDIYTASTDFGTRRSKTLNEMLFVADQTSGGAMMIRKSDNDFRSWSPFRAVQLNRAQPRLTRCGSFRKRALNIRHSVAAPFRIKASDLALDRGVL